MIVIRVIFDDRRRFVGNDEFRELAKPLLDLREIVLSQVMNLAKSLRQ